MQFWQVLIGLIMATQAERELYPNFVALAGVSCCGWLSWRRTGYVNEMQLICFTQQYTLWSSGIFGVNKC
ncbi:hypothetical protein AB3S75_011957 [Citrus x aurantiifolia]